MVFRASPLALALALALGGCKDDPPSAASASSAAPSPSAPSAAPVADTPPPSPSGPPAPPPTSVIVQHILVSYRGVKRAKLGITRSKAEARALAERVLARARQGDDFSDLVKQYSDDPAALERMGSTGRIKRDAMVKPFSDAAFALQVGEISGLVETEFGYHIIKRNQ